jgi:ubiquinone/menaquinone biosynthesis C-methylase UbiE
VSGGPPLADPQTWVASITEGFAAAADRYDADGTEFFQQTGAWLVETAGIPNEAWVLDVGCGKGAVALPAAQAVGPNGHVLGIDLAAPMLAHARDRAQQAGLSNVSFREGDAANLAWEPDTFDVVLGANVVQFLPRTAQTVTRWREVLVPCGLLGIAWTVGQEARWAPVLAAIDAYAPDGVPGFGAFMRRPPFGSAGAFEDLVTGSGFEHVATVTRDFTTTYRNPEQWWQVYQSQGPWAVSWRHIPPARLAQARRDAFAVLEDLRGPDGTLSRSLTVACTTGRKAEH